MTKRQAHHVLNRFDSLGEAELARLPGGAIELYRRAIEMTFDDYIRPRRPAKDPNHQPRAPHDNEPERPSRFGDRFRP